jgi:hypothetical protein
MNLLAIPSSLLRSYSTFLLCSWTTLIEIAVYKYIWEPCFYLIVANDYLKPKAFTIIIEYELCMY